MTSLEDAVSVFTSMSTEQRVRALSSPAYKITIAGVCCGFRTNPDEDVCWVKAVLARIFQAEDAALRARAIQACLDALRWIGSPPGDAVGNRD